MFLTGIYYYNSLQATAVYASLVNGGNIIKPNLIKNSKNKKLGRLVSKETSVSIK